MIIEKTVPSRSNLEDEHHLKIDTEKGTVHCDCKGFEFNHYCWVTMAYKKLTKKTLGDGGRHGIEDEKPEVRVKKDILQNQHWLNDVCD